MLKIDLVTNPFKELQHNLSDFHLFSFCFLIINSVIPMSLINFYKNMFFREFFLTIYYSKVIFKKFAEWQNFSSLHLYIDLKGRNWNKLIQNS